MHKKIKCIISGLIAITEVFYYFNVKIQNVPENTAYSPLTISPLSKF